MPGGRHARIVWGSPREESPGDLRSAFICVHSTLRNNTNKEEKKMSGKATGKYSGNRNRSEGKTIRPFE